MKKWFNEKILSSNKKTVCFISISVFFVLLIYQTILLCFGTYFNSSSDDIIQYSPILSQYINYFKEGKLSWFNYSNNLGMPVFADAYYLPIDIFSLITFLLSFLIKVEVAFSIVELIKVFLGVSVFAYFLQKCKYKNSTVLILSFAYFCLGGSWAFCVFPTYFSLFFYLPFSLLVVKWFCNGKRWVLPLYCVALIFYNFYNAYSLYIFMLLTYIVVCVRDNYRGFKILIKDAFVFGLHIVMGVAMGLVALVPSVLYIIGYSIRDGGEILAFFPYQVYFRMISKLFIIEAGPWNFFAGEGDIAKYEYTHFNYYIGIIGLVILSFLFHMKDRISKVYKWVIVGIIGMMIFPVFSSIISGYGTPYLRWICFINVILLVFIGHVLENAQWSKFTLKQKVINFSIIGGLYFISILYNLVVLWGEPFYSGGGKSIYYIFMLLMALVFVALYLVFCYAKQKNLFYMGIGLELAVVLLLNMLIPIAGSKQLNNVRTYDKINELFYNLNIEEDSLERVYLSNIRQYNESRFFDELTNEVTFHSFINKNIYDYRKLFANEDDHELLYINNLKSYSPVYSRTINYKYIAIDKNRQDIRLNYFPIYYEDNDYIVYENVNYEPFYVYEDYYQYEDVYGLRDHEDYIELNKKLFNGVILDNHQYDLNYLEFNYDGSSTEKIALYNKLNLEEKETNKYFSDFSRFNLDFKGYVMIKGNSYEGVEDVKIVDGEKRNSCYIEDDVYYCSHDGKFDGIEVIGSPKTMLEYSLVVKDKYDEYYAVYELNDIKDVYFEYYIKANQILYYVDESEKINSCLEGYCYIGDIQYGLISISFNSENNDKDLYYQQGNLDYYNLNKEDRYATDKGLTHEGSTISVKYKNVSTSGKDQIVVLPITYSEEWVCENENYDLVKANGAYLGLVVKNGVKDIDVNITFKPKGLKVGGIGSLFGVFIYGLYIFVTHNRKKRSEENESA